MKQGVPTTVQECPKVIASKHVRQVGQVTSAERGSLVTVRFAVNALGNVIPPFFIFPRVKYNESFVASGSPVPLRVIQRGKGAEIPRHGRKTC